MNCANQMRFSLFFFVDFESELFFQVNYYG